MNRRIRQEHEAACREGEINSRLATSNVSLVLDLFKKNNLIADWHQTKYNDEHDRRGIDFYVYLRSGYAIPLQLKYTKNLSVGRRKSIVAEHLASYPHLKFIFLMSEQDLVFDINDEAKLFLLAEKLSSVIFPKEKAA